MAERHSIEGSEPPVKRRKIRKGTKSCWECELSPSPCCQIISHAGSLLDTMHILVLVSFNYILRKRLQ